MDYFEGTMIIVDVILIQAFIVVLSWIMGAISSENTERIS